MLVGCAIGFEILKPVFLLILTDWLCLWIPQMDRNWALAIFMPTTDDRWTDNRQANGLLHCLCMHTGYRLAKARAWYIHLCHTLYSLCTHAQYTPMHAYIYMYVHVRMHLHCIYYIMVLCMEMIWELHYNIINLTISKGHHSLHCTHTPLWKVPECKFSCVY